MKPTNHIEFLRLLVYYLFHHTTAKYLVLREAVYNDIQMKGIGVAQIFRMYRILCSSELLYRNDFSYENIMIDRCISLRPYVRTYWSNRIIIIFGEQKLSHPDLPAYLILFKYVQCT